MAAVNGILDNYGTTLEDSALWEPETPIDSRKSLYPREIRPARVKLGLVIYITGRLGSVRGQRPPNRDADQVEGPRRRGIQSGQILTPAALREGLC